MEITPTAEEAARLRDVHRNFQRKLEGLSPRFQRARVEMAAHKPLGFGEGEVDPYERSLAMQTLKAMQLNEEIEAQKAELREIESTDLTAYRPRDPHYRERLLARKHDLEQGILANIARMTALADDDHSRAKQEAIRLYRAEAAHRERQERLQEAIARKEAEAEQRTIDEQAERIVAARRRRL